MKVESRYVGSFPVLDNKGKIPKKYLPTGLGGGGSVKNTASGEFLNLSDSIEAPLSNIKLFGKTTTCKNKLPYPYVDTANIEEGITDNGDGSLTISGSSYGFSLCDTNIFEDGKTYFLPALAPGVWVNVSYTNGDTNGVSEIVYGVGGPNGDKITWLSTYTLRGINIYFADGESWNTTIYPIIVEGESYDGVWEAYSTTLKNIGDNGGITECVLANNLFNNDTSLVEKVYNSTYWGYNLKLSPGVYNIMGHYVSNIICMVIFNVATNEYRASRQTSTGNMFNITLNEGECLIVYYTDEFATRDEAISYFESSQIQVSRGSKEIPYEPYKEQTLSVSTPNGLKGLEIPSWFGWEDYCSYNPTYIIDGAEYIADEINFKDMVRREPVRSLVFTGDEEWKKSGNSYSTNLPVTAAYGISSHFKALHPAKQAQGVDGTCVYNTSTVKINASQFTTVEEFVAFVKAQYEAGTPLTLVYAVKYVEDIIETPLTEAEVQAFKALRTSYPNTTFYNNDGAYTEVEYMADTKNYIDNKIALEVERLTAAIITE